MNSTALATVDEQPAALARAPDETGIAIDEIVARVDKIKQVQQRIMKEGVHFGVVPGTVSKPSLLKPGAELLCLTFQLDPQFTLDERHDGDHLEVVVTCTLYHSRSGARLGSGIGSCSTRESKYAYRKSERVCPKCDAAAIIKGKAEYGGGWLCYGKKGGCGAKFKDDDEAITGQDVGRIANPDLPDLYNTVRKMACKRAHVAACLFVTGGSELFTQDIEDMGDDREGPAQRNGGGKPASGARRNGNGGPNAPGGSEAFVKLSDEILSVHTSEELESLVPAARRAREQKTITPAEYQSLRDAYAFRKNELDAAGGDDIPF